ncbi:MAG TPA: Ig-like domain-containing protein [Vicinamibacterales bacterium]|nr:Ig-like domain-containing protein [Vicinamibacterales bacterium]
MKRPLSVVVTIIACSASSLLLSASVPAVPSGTWAAATPLTTARAGATAVSLGDGRVLIAGGRTLGSDGSLAVSASAEVFAADGSVTAAAPLTVARAAHAAVRLKDGRVLVTGGTTADGTDTASSEVFDPVSGVWSYAGTMGEPRSAHTASLLEDGRVLIAGGSALEIYDPLTGTFTFAGLLSPARREHAAAVLRDGRVVLAGGAGIDGALSAVDVFDPQVGVVPAGELATSRSGLTATTLVDGRVLFAGGYNGGDLSTLEIYDPASGVFEVLADTLSVPRSGHLAALLPHNNGILIAGGTSNGAAVSAAELFLSWRGTVRPTAASSFARAGAVAAPAVRDGVLLVAGGSDGTTPLTGSELYGFATLETDKDDYRPGSVVTITGTGWQPGETVTLRLQEAPRSHDDRVLTAVADENGDIFNDEFSPEDHHLGVRFYLTAVGAASEAGVTFTDDTVTNTIDTTADPGLEELTISAGESVSVSYEVRVTNGTPAGDPNGCNAQGSNPATVTLNVPAGVTASSSSLVFSGCGVPQSVTFSSSAPGTYTIAVASVTGGRSGSLWETAPASFRLIVQASDTTPPAAPFVDIGPGYVTPANEHAVLVSISGEAGGTVSGSVSSSGGGTPVALAGTIPSGGTLQLTLDLSGLADGTLTATATLTDDADNTSDPGSDTAVKDTQAPDAPSTPDLAAASDTGRSQADDVTSDSTPTFDGTAEAGSTVRIYRNGVEVGSGVATGGSYSITTLVSADGSYQFTARATDAAGNESAASPALTVTIDTVAPDAPSTPDLNAGSDSGASNSDNLTNVTAPVIDGTAETDSTVALYRNAAEHGTTVASAGAWSFVVPGLTDGAHTFTARATDAAGNVSDESAALVVTIDTIAPDAPVVNIVPAFINLANQTAVDITVTGEAGATLTLAAGALVLFDGVTDGSFEISADLSGLPDGAVTVTATLTDAAGNSSEPGSDSAVKDTVAPVIVLTTPGNGAVYTLNQIVQAAYTCSDTGGTGVASCTGTTAAGSPVDTSTIGAHTFGVAAVDLAGNAAEVTHGYTVQYGVCALYDQTKASKSGSTVPVKFFLCDASGANVSAAGIVVQATGLVRVSDSTTAVVEDSGHANPDGNFRFDPSLGPGGGYIFNLSTKGLQTGTWRLSFVTNGYAAAHHLFFGVR